MERNQDLVVATIANDKSLRSRFARAASDVSWAEEKEYALAIIRSIRELQECTPESFVTAMMSCAYSGLSLDPVRRQAYLIPWRMHKGGPREAKFTPSYIGFEQMALRAGTVRDIQCVVVSAEEVKQGKFRVRTVNGVRTVDHEEVMVRKRPYSHVYCIANYTRGGRHIEVMDEAAINGCIAAAARLNGGTVPFTWSNGNPFLEEQWKKSCSRRAAKHWPQDDGGLMARATEIMDKLEPMAFATKDEEARAKEPAVCFSDGDIEKLRLAMAEEGLQPSEAESWLGPLAQAMGFPSIHAVPVDRYDEAVERMRNRADKLRQRVMSGGPK